MNESSRKIFLSASGFPEISIFPPRIIEFLNTKLQISKLSCPMSEYRWTTIGSSIYMADLKDRVTRVANSILTKKVREDNSRRARRGGVTRCWRRAEAIATIDVFGHFLRNFASRVGFGLLLVPTFTHRVPFSKNGTPAILYFVFRFMGSFLSFFK